MHGRWAPLVLMEYMSLGIRYMLEGKRMKQLVFIDCLSTPLGKECTSGWSSALNTNNVKVYRSDRDPIVFLLPASPSVDICFIGV